MSIKGSIFSHEQLPLQYLLRSTSPTHTTTEPTKSIPLLWPSSLLPIAQATPHDILAPPSPNTQPILVPRNRRRLYSTWPKVSLHDPLDPSLIPRFRPQVFPPTPLLSALPNTPQTCPQSLQIRREVFGYNLPVTPIKSKGQRRSTSLK